MESRKCIECGKIYMPTSYNQKWCISCKPDRHKSRDKLCEWCGEPFYDDSKSNRFKYCSDKCRHLARNYQAAEFESKKRCRQLLAM